MNRHVTAVLLAPLTVPLLLTALVLQILKAPFPCWVRLRIAAAAWYAGAIRVGAPAYVVLRLRGLSLGCSLDWLDARVVRAIVLALVFPLALESAILTSVVQIFAMAHTG